MIEGLLELPSACPVACNQPCPTPSPIPAPLPVPALEPGPQASVHFSVAIEGLSVSDYILNHSIGYAVDIANAASITTGEVTIIEIREMEVASASEDGTIIETSATYINIVEQENDLVEFLIRLENPAFIFTCISGLDEFVDDINITDVEVVNMNPPPSSATLSAPSSSPPPATTPPTGNVLTVYYETDLELGWTSDWMGVETDSNFPVRRLLAKSF